MRASVIFVSSKSGEDVRRWLAIVGAESILRPAASKGAERLWRKLAVREREKKNAGRDGTFCEELPNQRRDRQKWID